VFDILHLSLSIFPKGLFFGTFMYLFKQSWPFETVSSSALHAALAQDSSVQPDFLNKDFRYALEALSFRPSEDCFSFLVQDFF
jgi:hypothetical protein